MKKAVWITILIAILLIAVVIYAIWAGFFNDGEPKVADNAVTSEPLPDYLAKAGLFTYEHFNDVEIGKVPDRYLFKGDGEAAVAEVPADTNLSLKLTSGEVNKEEPFSLNQSLPAQTGTFTAEVKMMQPEPGNAEWLMLTSEGEPVFTVKMKDGNLVVPGRDEPVFSGYNPGEWISIKVVANVEAGEADVYVNGLPAASGAAFDQKVELIDGWRSSSGDTAHYIDDVIIGPGKLDFPIGFATVGMLPVGGMGGETVTVSTPEELVAAISPPEPKIVYVDGELDFETMVKVNSNKTIIGVGDTAFIKNGGLQMENVSNVVIRNLHLVNSTDDAIEIRDGSKNIWIDHNTLTNAMDGTLDIRTASDFVTVSWNYFYDQGKTSLVGSSDDDTGDRGHLHVTYHHNRFFDTTSRNPMVRFGEGHIINNLYQDVGNYGVRAYTEGSLFVEGNAFNNTKTPFEIVGGQLEERNNLFVNSGEPITDGSVFDPFTYYTYTIHPAEDIVEMVEAGAGAGKLQSP